MQDDRGRFWAHPWPTWSRFADGGPGGSWDVPHAVRLRAIFCLSRAAQDRVEPLGRGEAVCLLEGAGEIGWHLVLVAGGSLEERKALSLQHFANLCNLVQGLPVYRLQISPDGEFWRELERVLTE